MCKQLEKGHFRQTASRYSYGRYSHGICSHGITVMAYTLVAMAFMVMAIDVSDKPQVCRKRITLDDVHERSAP